MSEHDEQVALLHWIDTFKSKYPQLDMAFAIPNGGHRHIAVARKLKAEGVRAGVPDIFLAQPAQGKHGLFIEMKSEKGKISPEQTEWLSFLNGNGYATFICYSWIEAAMAISNYLGIDLRKVGLK